MGYEVDKNGNHIIPENTAIPMDEAATVYKDRLGYIHNEPKSTAELIEEAKKLFQKPEPVKPLTPQQPNTNVNEVRKLNKLLKGE